MSTPAIPNSAGPSPAEPEAFNAGFKAALTKVKPNMRCLEVLAVKEDAWIEFVTAKSQNESSSATGNDGGSDVR